MRLVVVGGVAGGLSFAARARRLDENAEIIVLEKGPYPSFSNCGLPYYVGGDIPVRESLLLNTTESLRAKLNLDVRVNHEVTSLNPEAKTVTVRTPGGESETLNYDKLVLSPGARSARPPIPGLDSPRVHALRTVDDATQLAQLAGEAKTAVVIGGGFIGLEAGEALAKRGLRTIVVEASKHVMPPLDEEIAHMTVGALQALGIEVLEGTCVESVTPGTDADTVLFSDGRQEEAGVIVLSAGVVANTEPFVAAGVAHENGYILIDEHGRTNLPDVFALGDAAAQRAGVAQSVRPVALAGPTNRAGRLIADYICDPEHARPLPAPILTSIFRLGQMTIAQTGASRAELEAAGVAFHTIHTHPTDHGTFLPGAQPMQLLMHFAAEDGRILGAQGIGGNGVDKRIDVIATALRAGMKAPDLIDLDLAYSPPYSSAKDPVNFLGYVAQNVMSGLVELFYPWDIPQITQEGGFLLDVRNLPEFHAGHLRAATCIPLGELRGRLEEVRAGAKGGTVYVCDDTGQNAWLASRILRATGFNAKVLSGGVNTAFAYHFHNPGAVLEM